MNWHRIFELFFGSKQTKPVVPDRKILVVDDGDVERQFISRTLEKGGYQVKTADCGEAALELLKEEVPDLVLLDFVMPGINGDEVCKRIKMDDRTKNIPVVFLTGSIRPSSIISSFDSGAEYYLAKPIGAGELLKQVEMIFSQSPGAQMSGAAEDPAADRSN